MTTGFFYEAAIRIYSLIILLASSFVPKARLWVEGRKNWREKLSSRMAQKKPGQRVAWFHSASLGEFEQGRPVIEAFRNTYPDYFILLTFYSPSGYEVRKGYQGVDHIAYLPADTARNARDFVKIVKPEVAFFIKYEFWHHYLAELKRNDATVLLFAAIFRPEQVFFKWWGGFYREMLGYFDVLLVQNEASCILLERIPGLKRVIVAGDTRFDRVVQLVENGRELPEIATFVNGSTCMVVGSAWAPDMDVLIEVLNTQGRQLKVVIAPHEINSQEIEAWRARLNLPSILYSDYKMNGFIVPEEDPCYLFIDNIGMLSSLYRYGRLAYIGGSFGKGLHNTLEAATYGMPVFFGNKRYHRFSEAVALLEEGVATAISSSDELNKEIEHLLKDPGVMRQKSEASRRFVQSHIGATDKVMSALRTVRNQSRNSSSAR